MADQAPPPAPTPPPNDAQAHAFRTYASDVAALTGKPLPKDAKNETAAPVSAAPAKEVPAAPAPARPAPPPPEPPPAKIIPKAPSTEESRDEVLARLKARATPAAPPPQTAEAAAPAPKAPSTSETKEEVLARLRANAGGAAPVAAAAPPGPPPLRVKHSPPPLPQNAEASAAGPSPLHTYKTDFADRTSATGASRISMLAAEQDARGTPAPTVLPEKRNKNLLVYGLGALLIIAGVGSVYAAYRFATGRPAVPEELFIPSLIFADERVEVSGEGTELQAALSEAGARLPEGSVLVAYVTTSTTTPEGVVITEPADGGTLVRALALPAPEILLRNADELSTAGVVRAGGEARPFLILRVSSFERTFAGMLEWEPTMERDLALFYPAHPNVEAAPVGTSTATSTAPEPFARLGFGDEVVGNRDVRVLRDAEGRAVMLYGYRDRRTLVIARDEAAFLEILERLAASRAQ